MIASKKITDFLLYIAIAIFLFGSGYKYAEWKIINSARPGSNFTVFNANNPSAKKTKTENIDFSLFWATWDKLQEKYVDKKKLDTQKMYYGAIKGLVASLGDPYSFFLTPEENKQSKDDLGGKFQGIGAQLGLKDGKIVVIAPLKDSPAEEAGLKTDDLILKVDGESTEKWALAQAVNKIRGPDNTKVILTVLRNGKSLDISITRREIKVPSIELTYEKINGQTVANIKLSQFGDNTNSEWDVAAAEVIRKWKSKEIKGLVIDVRGNPGGYLESAVYIASEFLDVGKVIVKQETANQPDRINTVKRTGQLLDIPLALLINEGSASASEILSGSLRDHKRAVLVGHKSFGKGSVQEALDLDKGAGLHVTIAKWILPKGDWINGIGITPEYLVDNQADTENTLTNANDLQLLKALELVSN